MKSLVLLALSISSVVFAAPSTPLTVQVNSATETDVHDGAGNVILSLKCQSDLTSATTYHVDCPAAMNGGNSFESELTFDPSQDQWGSPKAEALVFDGQHLPMSCSAADQPGKQTPSFQLFVCSQGD